MTIEQPAPHRFVAPRSKPREITRNTVQVNVCVVVDVAQTLAAGSLDGALTMVDNSVTIAGGPSPGRGTAELATQCTYGTVVNWILYYTVAPYGTRCRSNSSISASRSRFASSSNAMARSPGTRRPTRFRRHARLQLLAGLVIPDLPPKRYPYTIELKIGDLCVAVSTPSLEVWTIPAPVARKSLQTDGGMTRGEIG
ncbi:MAG: hypothetical protein WDN44_04050 [Sphingomonas sp.]